MTFSNVDTLLMQRALYLARKGIKTVTPNPAVGCVIADEQGKILAEGYHQKAGQPHAEINALRQLNANVDILEKTTVYVTLEPCSHQGKTGSCAQELVRRKVGRVVYAMQDPNPLVAGSGIAMLRNAGVSVEGPLLEAQAKDLNRGFAKRMEVGLPFVQIKMASSLDGRTAMADGTSQWITGEAARRDVQTMRAQSCAIIIGADTVIADDPALTVRFDSVAADYRQPYRIIIDSRLRTEADAKIYHQHGKTFIAANAKVAKTQTKFPPERFIAISHKENKVNLRELLQKLAHMGCNSVLVESGPTLAGAFVQQQLVDEIVLYQAPCLMGSEARPMFDLPISSMLNKQRLKIKDVRKVGDDMRIVMSF